MVGAVVTKNWLQKKNLFHRDPSQQSTEHRFRNKETLLFLAKNFFSPSFQYWSFTQFPLDVNSSTFCRGNWSATAGSKLTIQCRFYYKKKLVKRQAKKIKLAVPRVVAKTLAGHFRKHEFRFYYQPIPPSTHGAVHDSRLIWCSFLALFCGIASTKSYEP